MGPLDRLDAKFGEEARMRRTTWLQPERNPTGSKGHCAGRIVPPLNPAGTEKSRSNGIATAMDPVGISDGNQWDEGPRHKGIRRPGVPAPASASPAVGRKRVESAASPGHRPGHSPLRTRGGGAHAPRRSMRSPRASRRHRPPWRGVGGRVKFSQPTANSLVRGRVG